MVTYLVMKNNLKRTFTARFTYTVMLFIPIAISCFSIVTGSFSDAVASDTYPMIHYERAEGISQTESAFALLFTAYLIVASIYATDMIHDKKNGTMERFRFAGFTKNAYRMGYMASTALIMLCQLTLAVIILTVFDQNFSISLGRAIEQILFMAAVASVFGVGVASFLKSDLSANITASSIVVILSLLGGTFVSVEQMPRLLQWVSMISPIRWLQFLP